jgi:hypothetical protein
LLQSIDGILIETEAKMAYQSNHVDGPIFTYDGFEQDCALFVLRHSTMVTVAPGKRYGRAEKRWAKLGFGVLSYES